MPGTWNLSFGEELFRYKGAAWYARDFEAPDEDRLRLHFGAVFLDAEVWVNGEAVGSHRGGYTPLEVEISDALRPGTNELVLRVDNRLSRTTIPCLTIANPEGHGWYPYGGSTRSVRLLGDDGLRPVKLDLRTSPAPRAVGVDASRPTPGRQRAEFAIGPYTCPDVGASHPWHLSVGVALHNDSATARAERLSVEIQDPDGATVARLDAGSIAVAPGEIASFRGEVTIDEVRVWSRERPWHRYRARGRLGDTWAENSFGFRMEWEQSTGKPHPATLTNLKGLVDQNRRPKPGFATVRELYGIIESRQ